MIKFVAAVLMLIDHVGAILLPELPVLRVIGRLSMPMFAFSLARAFRFADNGNIINFKQYFCRLFTFSIVSQFPYHFFKNDTLNIGFTWLLAFFFLSLLTHKKTINNYLLCICIAAICATPFFLPIEYGIYGVVYPAMFHYCYYKLKKPEYAFAGSALLFVAWLVLDGSFLQVFAIFAAPLVLLLEKFDKKIIVSKWFYYGFYPVHIALLLLIRYCFFPHL